MSDNDKITQTIEWKDTGTEQVIRGAEMVGDSVEEAMRRINEANDALGGLNTKINDMPTLTLPPPMPIPFDTESVKDATRQIEKVSDSAIDAGKASEMLYSALDNVIPGLGGVAESLFSLNPVAVAGTAAIAALTLVFAEQQRQAEESRKAIEASIKAEAERVSEELALEQRVNLALSGNKAAREAIITDLAANVAKATELNALFVENEGKILAKKKEIEQQNALAEQNKITGMRGQVTYNDAGFDALVKVRAAEASIESLTTAAADLKAQLDDNTTQSTKLNAAAKDVEITMAEHSAVMKAVETGADGANAALQSLWQTSGDGSKEANAIVLDGIQRLAKGAQDFAEFARQSSEVNVKLAEETAKAREEAEKRLIEVSEKLTEVELDRGQALADRFTEEQRAVEFTKLNTQLEAAQAIDAAVTKNKKVAEIEQQGQEAEIAAQQKYMESQQKLLANYLKAEQNATEDYSRERVRKLEDLYNTLGNLASQRDVAGFVNARRSGMTDIGRGDEDAGTAARRRREQYDQQQSDLVSAVNKETATRQAQLQQRLQQEQQAGQQQISMADRVNKQIADLRAQYAAQDLRARRMAEDATYRQTVEILQAKRTAELKITAGAAAGVIGILSSMRDTVTRLGSSVAQGAARGIPRFEEGTPFTSRGGLAIVDPGERIMTAAENARFMRGGSGAPPNLTIQNLNVGKVATQSDIDAAVGVVVNAFTSFAGNSN